MHKRFGFFGGMTRFFAPEGGGAGGDDGGDQGTGAPGGDAVDGGGQSATPPAGATDPFSGLSAENKKFFEAKGWNRGGENGGPVSLDSVFNSLRSAESLIGKQNIAQPDPEHLADWGGFKAAGVPDTADGYKITRPEMPKLSNGEPMPYDEAAEKTLLQAMHKGKVPAAMAQGVFDEMVALQIARAQAFDQEVQKDRDDTEATLNREWGAQRNTKVAQAQNAMKQLAEKIGVDPATLASDTNAAMGSAGAVKLFAWLAQNLGEDVIVPADGRVGDVNTPAGAAATLANMEADPVWSAALNDRNNPRHAEAVARRVDLNKRAHPG